MASVDEIESNGVYVNWETDVNLSPPKALEKDAPDEDKHLQTYYNALQRILFETGQPETIDRTQRPRKLQNKEYVNVAILSSPGECIGVLLEGGKQLPDGFHLVLSPSWLSTAPSEEDASLNTLLLHKSIAFHACGASFIDEFEPPRRVTYFVNNFTNFTHCHRDGGLGSEIPLDCPMGSSLKLSEAIDDTVWTRDIMAEAGMAIPETLAIRRMPTQKLGFEKHKIKCIDFDDYSTLDMAYIEKEILHFSSKLQQSRIQKIVVKVSGPMDQGRYGTSIHRSEDAVSIFQSAKDILMEIGERCSVLVEEFVESTLPFEIGTKHAKLWSANDGAGFRMNVTVCRDHDGTPVTTLVQCAVTERFCNSSDNNIVWQSLDSTLLTFNIFDEAVRTELERKIRTQSAAVLKVLMMRESLLAFDERGAREAQTDVIGINMKVTRKDETLVPVGIDFNNRCCGTDTHLYDFMMNLWDEMLVPRHDMINSSSSHKKTNSVPSSGPICVEKIREQDMQEVNGCMPSSNSVTEAEEIENGFIKYNKYIQESRYHFGDTLGQSIRPLVRTMITRSQRYIMKGKQIIVIGGSTYARRKAWSKAAMCGVKVILVEANPNHWAREHVYRFFQYASDDHSKDEEHAVEIANLIKKHGMKADGCLTFTDEYFPLSTLLNKTLDTKGVRYEAALTASKKSRMQNLLNMRRANIPHWPRANLYGTLAVHLTAETDWSAVPENFKFPAMLKLENGGFSVAASVVKNMDELKNTFLQVTGSLRSNSDFPNIGLNHGNSMMVMEFYEGSEHIIDVMIYHRKLVGAILTDSGRVRRPYFTATGRCMPSALPRDKQAQLVTAAYQCCIETGLSHGLYNVEMIMTATGPKLMEINPRVGGYLFGDWAWKVYGVNPELCALMIASDIKPYFPKRQPDTVLMGVMLLPSIHASTWKDGNFKSLLNQMIETEEIIFTQFKEQIEAADPGYEIAFGNIAVSASSADWAKNKLISVCRALGVDKENYRVEEIIQHL